jgi:hypothetical protein
MTNTLYRAGWRFPVVLALLLALLPSLYPPVLGGDVIEYTLDTVAIATHGTPDIRLQDIARAKQMQPGLAAGYELLEKDMRVGKRPEFQAFIQGRSGDVYPVHFFGYPMLAALPFKVLEQLGAPPFKAFQFVNLLAVFILGLALQRFFGSSFKALAGVALFLLCGGWLYWNWSSPECVSAAALLSGMLLFTSGAPVAGAVLAGLAGQQNPTIVFFFGFAPLLLLVQGYRSGAGVKANLQAILTRRHLAGLALGAAVFALPPLFNLVQYGTPNPIAKLFSDPALIGLVRLESFFFDLNQGMILAIPAVLAALAVWGWNRHRALPVLAVCFAFTLALAVPALAVLNWNSGALGVMRYAFWAAMPLLFALLLRLRDSVRWPAPLLVGIVLVQAFFMFHAGRYGYVEFSPVALRLLAHAPALYHPEPEIFAERMAHNDDYIQPDKVYVYKVDGKVVKTLVNRDNPQLDTELCGSGAVLAPDNKFTDSYRGWRYIDGPARCTPAGTGIAAQAPKP